MDSRWTQLAARSHISGAIDFSRAITAPSWDVKEAVIFRSIENELLAKMNEMLYMEHIILEGSAGGDAFNDETEGAQSKYNACGRLAMPWLQWAPIKTAEQAMREAQKRRQDPNHMAVLERMQQELDAEAKKLSDAVKAEVELRDRAVEHAKKLKQQPRRRKRHGGLSRRAKKSKRR